MEVGKIEAAEKNKTKQKSTAFSTATCHSAPEQTCEIKGNHL